MKTQAGSPQSSVCVQCGRTNAQALYKKFTGGTIQLSHCVRIFKKKCMFHPSFFTMIHNSHTVGMSLTSMLR